MVQMWLSQKLDEYWTAGWIASPPVHARSIALLDRYTRHMSEMMQIDRTPLPFSYVQMAATLLVAYCCLMPFAIVDHFGGAFKTPLIAALVAYAYSGLYINACCMRNPFNYEGTLTGIPINVFLQRMQRVTETLLCDCSMDYENISNTVIQFQPLLKA